MKIERISENKLKITLAKDDLLKWDLKFEDLSYNSPRVQEMFWSVVKKAENETEFFTEDSQLVIEAMANSKDGFIIFITKVDDEDGLMPIHKQFSKYFGDSASEEKDEDELNEEVLPYNMYSFGEFENVCLSCKMIDKFFTGKSDLKKYKNTYYLYLFYNDICEEEEMLVDTVISEYGNLVENPVLYDGLINEYGKVIVQDCAVSVLKEYSIE